MICEHTLCSRNIVPVWFSGFTTCLVCYEAYELCHYLIASKYLLIYEYSSIIIRFDAAIVICTSCFAIIPTIMVNPKTRESGKLENAVSAVPKCDSVIVTTNEGNCFGTETTINEIWKCHKDFHWYGHKHPAEQKDTAYHVVQHSQITR